MKNLNTFRKGLGKACPAILLLLAGLCSICFAPSTASALDPNRAMSQYTHDFWGAEQGFPGGTVYAVAQTNDGYLWLGTEKGLVRFDGLRFDVFYPDEKSQPESEPIIGLTIDAEGSLWMRLLSSKIFRYRNGKFEDVFNDSKEGNYQITAMERGKDGGVLVSKLERGLFKYGGENFANLIDKGNLPPSVVISAAETETGDVWLGTREAGLFRLGGQRQLSHVADGLPDRKINCILPDGSQNLWIGTDKGIARWNGAEIVKPDVSPDLKNSRVLKILKDKQSNLWIATESNGLIRLNQNGEASTKGLEFPSSKTVTALFEDREENLWVGTPDGIERLRDNRFITYSVAEGLPPGDGGAIYVDSEMRTWFAPSGGGLYWLKDGRIEKVVSDGIDKDVIYSIWGDDGTGDLWLGRQRGGLTRLHHNDGASFSSETFNQANGLAQSSVLAVYKSTDGSIWSGTSTGGASRLKDGNFTTYTTAQGLVSNTVTAIAETADGAMWFATPTGLSSFQADRWQNYTPKNDLPSEKVNSLYVDEGGILWIGTAKGLAFFDSGRIHFNEDMPASLREPILGIASDKNNSIWVATANHVLRVEREKLLQGAVRGEDVREFNSSDGLESTEGVKRSRSVAADSMGRVWFYLSRGISMVDANRLKSESAPALVQIQTIAVDGSAVESRDDVSIGSGHQKFAFNYAGLSLANPANVKYRYRLDGFDKDWSEPTAVREAVYTNLNPGLYSFHVIASNSDGLWNSSEAVLRIQVEPAFWQTLWFEVLCTAVFALAIMALYRLRLRRVTNRLNARFEERLAERTRIAQELHDSLLQGFVSVSMQLGVAVDNLPDGFTPKKQFSRILELMNQVKAEGRNTLRGLRSPNGNNSGNLEQAFAEIKQDSIEREQAEFRVVVEGAPRPLRPIMREEAYRIGREALLNAFRHSGAKKVEIIVEYAAKHLKILVRDDGRGIDPHILNQGREGHWGLVGMRERAKKIESQLKVWSRADAGTEIELIVPHHVAFEKESANRPLRWFSKIAPSRSNSNSKLQAGQSAREKKK